MAKFKDISISIRPSSDDIIKLQSYLIENFDAIQKEFLAFLDSIKPIIKEAEELVKKAFDNDPVQLEEDMDKRASLSYTVGKFFVDACTYLNVYEIIHYQPKSDKISEADRKRTLRYKTSVQNSVFSNLKNLCEKLDKKVSVGQSILKFETQRFLKENI